MRAVIQVLAAEIPDVQPRGRFTALQTGGGDQDAVSGGLVAVVALVPQAAADLGLADAAIAQDDQLNVGDEFRPRFEVPKMRADCCKAIVVEVLRQRFCRHPRNPGFVQYQHLQ